MALLRRGRPRILARCLVRTAGGLTFLCYHRLTPRRKPREVIVEIAVEFRDLPIRDENECVAHRPQQRTVVRDQHHAALEFGQRRSESVPHFQVQMVGRLVEEQQIRPLPHEKREHETRLLASGERSDLRIGHRTAEIKPAQIVAQVLLAGCGIQPHEVRKRRFVGAQLFELVLREVADRESPALHPAARERFQLAGENPHQGRFARTVGSEQTDARARPQRQGKTAQHGPLPVAGRDRIQREQRIGRARRLGKMEIERRVDVGGTDAFHAVERLQPALRLARLGGLGAKARDETLEVGDGALLLLVQGLLHRELRGAALLEHRVVAGVQRQAAVADVRDMSDAAVEEIAVV